VSALASLRFGNGGALGAPAMKFTLTYDGELRSNGDPRQKWEIRKYLHPQLDELWRIDPALVRLLKFRYVPQGGYWHSEMHHSVMDERKPAEPDPTSIDLCKPIERENRQFVPIVRDSLLLKCGLKITFLRKEEPGRLYQAGDLDNRLKTLFDALSIPNKEQIVDDPTMVGPIYTLLEDDALITKLDVETHRLLSRPNASKHEVRLIIEVTVSVTESRLYNQPFLGG
jgi:hypothetical protein